MRMQTIPQVLSLHFVFEDPTTPDPVSIGLPPLNANMTQFYSISELFLRVIEPVCLVCLDPLSQQLAEITSLIEDVLDNLSGPGVGEIELDINSTEVYVCPFWCQSGVWQSAICRESWLI